jgi:hypothetical protein
MTNRIENARLLEYAFMLVNLKNNVNTHAVLFIQINETPRTSEGSGCRFLVDEYFGRFV